MVSIQLSHMVTCATYPEKFIRDNVVALFLQLSIVTVPQTKHLLYLDLNIVNIPSAA